MTEQIVPRLGYIEFFEENSFHHSDVPVYDGDEWYIQGRFSVVDEVTKEYNKTKPFYKRAKGDKDGDLGSVFPFVMCSKGYAKKYHKEFEEDGIKPIIMDAFNVAAATELIAQKIKEAGDHITIEKLWAHLETFSDTKYDDVESVDPER